MEENNKDKGFELAETEQNFAIVTTISNFEINKTDSENIASSLKEKAVAKLVGTFTAKTAGKKNLTAIFNYGEGDDATAVTETEVIAVKLAIALVAPVSLPTSLPKNFKQKVEFVIKYSNEFDMAGLSEKEIAELAATGIAIEGLDELADVNISKETLENVVVTGNEKLNIEDFKKDIKNSTVQLEPGHQFRIKGTFTMSDIKKILRILVKYAEFEYLTIESDKKAAEFEQTIAIQAIEIVGAVTTSLPAKIKLGSEHQVVFQFTNNNTEFSATGVNITITEANEKLAFSEQEFSEAN